MKTIIKQWWFWVAVAIIIISAFTPQIISAIYPMEGVWFTVTSFEDNELLSFYGNFLSFIGTVSLGALALWQNHGISKKNEQLENRLFISEHTTKITTIRSLGLDKLPYTPSNVKELSSPFSNYNILSTNRKEHNIDASLWFSLYVDADNHLIKFFRVNKLTIVTNGKCKFGNMPSMLSYEFESINNNYFPPAANHDLFHIVAMINNSKIDELDKIYKGSFFATMEIEYINMVGVKTIETICFTANYKEKAIFETSKFFNQNPKYEIYDTEEK